MFSFEGVLHSEVAFTPKFSFGRILCSGEFCIQASFAFGRVLHSGEFCIRASFAFGRVLHSGEFCIWASFAFWRVLHSSIPYSLANRKALIKRERKSSQVSLGGPEKL